MRERLEKKKEELVHRTKENINNFNQEIQKLQATAAGGIRSSNYRFSVRELMRPSIKIQ